MNQHARAAMPLEHSPLEHSSDDGYVTRPDGPLREDPRAATLNKLARLRDTIADLQTAGATPPASGERPTASMTQAPRTQPPMTQPPMTHAGRYAEAHPSPARPDNLEGAVSRILRRRQALEDEARADGEVRGRLPGELNAVRQQLDALTHAFQEGRTDAGTGEAALSALRDDLRSEMSRRLEDQVEEIDARMSRRLHQHIDPQRDAAEKSVGNVHAALRDLAERFDDETRRVTDTVTGVGDVMSREVGREVRDANAEMAATLSADLAARVPAAVRGDLETVATRLGDRIAETVTGVETAMRGQGEALSAQTRAVYEQVLGAIGDLTDTVATRITQGPDQDGQAAALAETERRLDVIAETLATIERNVNDAPVLRRMERELRALTDPETGLEARIGSGLDARLDAFGTRLAETGRTPADTALLTEIEAKIDDLSGRVAHSFGDPQALQRLETELGALQERVLASARDGREALDALTLKIETDRATPLKPMMEALETRIADLQGQIERRLEMGPAVSALAEEQIDTLIARIEALVASSAPGTDGPAAAQIEHQLSELMARFERHAEVQAEMRAEMRGGRRGDGGETGGLTRDAVIEAVHQAAGDILHTALDGAASAGGHQATQAVEAGLAELRRLQESGERRTNEALELVRDTVERVFHHLERIDAGARPSGAVQTDPAIPAPKPAPKPAPMPARVVAAPTPEPTPEPMPAPDITSSFAVDDRLRAARAGRLDLAHDMPEDFAPIAPGGAQVGAHAGAHAGAPEGTDIDAVSTPSDEDGGGPQSARASFIAAARRAAQESAAQEAAQAEAPKSRRRRAKAAKAAKAKNLAASANAGSGADTDGGMAADFAAGSDPASGDGRVTRLAGMRRAMRNPRMRPALLAAAAILLAIGTVKLATNVIVPGDAPDMAAVKPIEAPVDDVVTPRETARTAPIEGSEPTQRTVGQPMAGDGVPRFVPGAAPGGTPDANVARLETLPDVGRPDQFAPTDTLAADLGSRASVSSTLEPGAELAILDPAMLDPAALEAVEPAPNAASVRSDMTQSAPVQSASAQSLLANASTATPTPAGPEPALLASLPEAIGPEPLRIAAASGDPVAQYEIARRMGAGETVAKDDAAALAWLERAAAQDLAPAQYRLGSFYENGVGTERDVSIARAWYERASAQGNARAMHNTGVLYAEGAFGEADFEQAVGWFEKGARLGVPDSQFNLGIVYGRGLGVPQDLASAYMWFDASAKAGDTDAAAKRDEVAAAMEPATLERAKAMAAELVISEPAPEANAVVLPAQFGAPRSARAERPAQLTAEEQAMLIKQVQAVLTHRGYDVGPIDGIPGGRTATAIRAFQTANGLPANGRIDEVLLEALTSGSG